ncbi:cytochrome c oxidase subunit II [Nocardioides sp. SYSU D00038]|uniref:aa3-type cytochrome oxidase subunit II n=1 Tax=Nocardioides sp. SYSU D00038 TaxID=2812554 RepID=UPI0027DB07A5|nr:cytochrome c oxidase subunit II [Nocardioides sp. SYSU D00038]
MSLQLPRRAAGKRGIPRTAALVVLGLSTLFLAGCSDETAAGRLAMPDPASEQGEHILNLWQGAWIAALITGGLVWGLIFYATWRFRRRSADDPIPVQTRYNLPLEIFYTIAPVIMVIVFFNHTVKTQNLVLEESERPDHTVYVVGQKWSWTFNYVEEPAGDGKVLFEAGTGSYIPKLVLPVGETTRFELRSPDVIHDFGVPGFLMKMDVIPGRNNHYEIKPTAEGTYRGACYELCGTYHSRMLFTVDVVSPEEYEDYLEELAATGKNDADDIVEGPAGAYQPAGMHEDEETS